MAGLHIHPPGLPPIDFDWPGLTVGTPDLPHLPPILDDGGLVLRPTLAMLAMNGRPEAVVPLDKAGGLGGSTVYNLTANYAYQPERTLRDDIRLLQFMGAGV